MGAALCFKKRKEKLETTVESLFEISAEDIDGQEHLLADLAKDKKCIMVVNVASKCGLTKTHYTQMVKIHNKYKDKGFEIFAFPCNQFLSQEPGSNEDIKKFAREKYGAEFQLFSKIDVNGPNTHEVFRFCRRHSPLYDDETDTIQNIPWNFAKFLIDEEGNVVNYYSPKSNPDVCVPMIEEMLGL
ncbi:unnamed protein product [Moneuplotes crassus]|uniref:Glutathione peroxidase n=1 Tax=Euplotes crassus TaxID=5936 RepID=A0AAD1XXA7_EUPCR|nr:unnamed protein product [Moneuplotes crassus]CAI2379915.1 unnamed protein product [Moneuplotes crassus]